MSVTWVIAVPLVLALMLLALDRLESFVVAPMDRAARVRILLEDNAASDEQVAREVARLLAPVAPPASEGSRSARLASEGRSARLAG